MKFLILCVLVAASSAFDFDCLKGPDFWCANVANAQKCGKTSECFMKYEKPIEFVVKPSPSMNEDDIWCSSCINFVEFAEENVPTYTQDQFLEFLKKETCDKLKPSLINICKVFVAEYGPMVYKKIQNIKNPKLICSILRACPASGLESPLELFIDLKSNRASDICSECKEFFRVLESMFSKISPDEFKFLLETVLCGQLPSALQSTCKMLVSGYSGQLYQLIKTLLDGSRICPLIHFCPQNETKLGTWNCQTCLDVIVVLKKDLANVPESDVESYLKSTICSKLPFLGRDICNRYVSSLTPTFINDIKSAMTPQQICNKNKVCSSYSPKAVLKTSLKVLGIQCEACELAVREIKKYISDPNKKAIFKNFLKQDFCLIFQSKKSQCQQFIDENFDMFFNLLIAELDVQKVCHVLNLCSAVVKSRGDAECAVCNQVIREVIQIAFSNRSEQIVANFLITEVCPHLGFVKYDCTVLVNSYLPSIFSIAQSTLDSKVICSELHLCSVISHKSIELIKEQLPKDTMKCKLCLFLLNETKFLLTDPAIQTTIENFIKNEVCVHFGAKQNECVNDITEYFSLVINVIVGFLNPSLCSEFHFCNSTIRSPSPVQRHPLINLVKSKPIVSECPLCVKFYNHLQSLNDNKVSTAASIVLELVQLCNEQGQEMKSKCLKNFQYFDGIIKSFNKSKNLVEFCQMAKICSSEVKPNVIGSNPCAWGPGFWCLSEKHATACGPGAVKHCEMKIWNQRPIL